MSLKHLLEEFNFEPTREELEDARNDFNNWYHKNYTRVMQQDTLSDRQLDVKIEGDFINIP